MDRKEYIVAFLIRIGRFSYPVAARRWSLQLEDANSMMSSVTDEIWWKVKHPGFYLQVEKLLFSTERC